MKFAFLFCSLLALGMATNDDSLINNSNKLLNAYHVDLIETLRTVIHTQRRSLEKCAKLNAEETQKLKEEIGELHTKNEFYSETLDQLARTKVFIESKIENQLLICDNLKEEYTAFNITFEEQRGLINLLKSQVNLKNKHVGELNYQKKRYLQRIKTQSEMCKLQNVKPSSCRSFGNSSGIYEITVADFDSFPILCDSQTAGPGWAVIQRRINGQVNFQRNWTEYRNGFGSLDGEFFIGLEKLHRLTTISRHALYVHMRSVSGVIRFVHYDNFVVGSEYRQYQLQSVGVATGNVTQDCLKSLVGIRFSTFDRDNDGWAHGNCALELNGGWWHTTCGNCNLNGKMGKGENLDLFWEDDDLSMVKILMRPYSK